MRQALGTLAAWGTLPAGNALLQVGRCQTRPAYNLPFVRVRSACGTFLSSLERTDQASWSALETIMTEKQCIYTGVSATVDEENAIRAPLKITLTAFGPIAQPGQHERIYQFALSHGLPKITGWYGYDFERHEFTREPFHEAIGDFVGACIGSGMRETHCEHCGCYLLTRGDVDLCPPCRQKLVGPHSAC